MSSVGDQTKCPTVGVPLTNEIVMSQKGVSIAEHDSGNEPTKRNTFYNHEPFNNNELHLIREKEKELQSKQIHRLLMQRNRTIERKKLSSAYAQTKNAVIPSRKLETPSNIVNPINNSSRNVLTPNRLQVSKLEEPEEDLKVNLELNLEEKKDFDFGYHFVHSSSKAVSVARDLSSLKRPLHKEIIHKSSYFTPSLVDLCAEAIADQFDKIEPSSIRRLDEHLLRKITTRLSVELPLQISVPLIDDESYWKKCCYMRWSDGQLGTFVKRTGSNLFHERKPSSIDEILLTGSFEAVTSMTKGKANNIPSTADKGSKKTWKQLYLERNLQEFLENMQSARSLLQELHVLEQDPEADDKEKRQFELEILQAAHDVGKIEKSKLIRNQQEYDQAKKELEQFDGNEEKDMAHLSEPITNTLNQNYISSTNFTQLHSHRMRPNLNYYLLHANADYSEEFEDPLSGKPKRKKKQPDEEEDISPKYRGAIDLPECAAFFRSRLKCLFDGSESRNASRLNHLTSDDDVFTFYNNAIYRNHYKHKDSGEDLQYWLLSKDDRNLSSDVKTMYSFVRSYNKRLLDELCHISSAYIQEIEVLSLRATYISIQKLLLSLPNLKSLLLSKGVRNAGMSFELKMFGMSTIDCKSLAHCLKLPTCQITQLQLPENMIDDEMLQILLSGLVQNDKVQHLDLSHNKIRAQGCLSLSAYLRQTKSLKTLNLCDNNVRTEGCSYLSIALRQNTSLRELSLRLNRLSDETGKILFDAITENEVLEYINLSGNQLATESAQHLASTVLISSSCKSLIRLDLSGNMFGEEGGKALAIGLDRCPRKVVLLDIRSCKVRMEEASQIAQIVSKNIQFFNNS